MHRPTQGGPGALRLRRCSGRCVGASRRGVRVFETEWSSRVTRPWPRLCGGNPGRRRVTSRCGSGCRSAKDRTRDLRDEPVFSAPNPTGCAGRQDRSCGAHCPAQRASSSVAGPKNLPQSGAGRPGIRLKRGGLLPVSFATPSLFATPKLYVHI